MTGSRDAAESGKGRAVRRHAGRAAGLFRRLLPWMATCLAACSAGAPPAPISVAPALLDGIATAVAVPAPRPARIGRFEGMRAARLVALLGPPDLRRADPPAELWQYRTAECVLDLYLYRDGKGYRVIHAETRNRGFAGTGACRDGPPLRTRLRQRSL